MLERRLFHLDRRSGKDRRQVHNLDYFFKGGLERRSFNERRWQLERRTDWIRVGKWSSVFSENLGV